MLIKDRIIDFRRVPAKQLTPHPKNWRSHPEDQRKVLGGVLAEIGYADALLAREMPDGSLQLIDGHLRAEATPDQDVPVLLLDLNDSETEKLLTLFDPISAMASSNKELLEELVASIETSNESLQKFLEELSLQNEPLMPSEKDITVPTLFQILIDCENETQQRELYEELSDRGVAIKILNM